MPEASVDVAAAAFALAPALALGGFLDVVIRRVPAGRSVVRPPSSCDNCSTEIRWSDKLPVVSYVVLRGRCRACGARISPATPALEALTAAVIVVCVGVFGPTVAAALMASGGVLLIALAGLRLQRRSQQDAA
jgi:leader peptidase (prepilin peptidase)/N-methyltransferase